MTEIRAWNYDTRPTRGTASAFKLGRLSFYFSYETLIAFSDDGELTIRLNEWSGTTGRHLNSINRDEKKRVPPDVFFKKLDQVLAKYNLKGV
jgi:hypothetical protein